MINNVIHIIKKSNLGIISDMPNWIIKIWLYYRLYWLKSDVLITDKEQLGFILYNTLNKEIVIIAVDPMMRNEGIGSDLISRLPRATIVVHRKKHPSYSFFRKNNFVTEIDLNDKQVLSKKI